MLYLGADHRGYKLKEELKIFLQRENIAFEDLGNKKYDKDDDYPDWAQKVAEKVSSSPEEDRGILICGTGIGMVITANKFSHVRAGICSSSEIAQRAKEEDDINILCLGADSINTATAQQIVERWWQTSFLQEERYQRRINKIKEIEKNQ